MNPLVKVDALMHCLPTALVGECASWSNDFVLTTLIWRGFAFWEFRLEVDWDFWISCRLPVLCCFLCR